MQLIDFTDKMKTNTPVNDGANCGQSADSADNVRTSESEVDKVLRQLGEAWSEWIRITCKDLKPYKPDPRGRIRIIGFKGLETPRTITADETLQAIIEDERDLAPSTFMKGREMDAPQTISEAFGLPAGSFVKHLEESKASGMSHEERSMLPTPASHEEPWSVGEYNCKTSVVNAAGDEVAVFDSDKDADLAIKCVNACQGIADPVEAIRVLRDIQDNPRIQAMLERFAPGTHAALAKLTPA